MTGLRRAAGERLVAGCDWRDYGSLQGVDPLVDAAEALSLHAPSPAGTVRTSVSMFEIGDRDDRGSSALAA